MDDAQRLDSLRQRLDRLAGLDEDRFRRLTTELERPAARPGYDEQGRFRVAFFDAKSYDVAAFDCQNNHEFALQYIPASLSHETVHAAAGRKHDVAPQ